MAKGNFGGDETGFYGTVVVDTSLYAFDKTYRSVHHKEWILLMQIKKKSTRILKRPQGGMQTMSNESNCIANAWHNILEGDEEERTHYRPEKPKQKWQQNATWHPGWAPRTAKDVHRKTGEIQSLDLVNSDIPMLIS